MILIKQQIFQMEGIEKDLQNRQTQMLQEAEALSERMRTGNNRNNHTIIGTMTLKSI